MEEIRSEESRPTHPKKDDNKPKANRQMRKASEIEEYQKALYQLRSECRTFHKPFERQRLNISTMQAIKVHLRLGR
jgi:ABC-type phosphate transport system auxiliary subunit